MTNTRAVIVFGLAFPTAGILLMAANLVLLGSDSPNPRREIYPLHEDQHLLAARQAEREEAELAELRSSWVSSPEDGPFRPEWNQQAVNELQYRQRARAQYERDALQESLRFRETLYLRASEAARVERSTSEKVSLCGLGFFVAWLVSQLGRAFRTKPEIES